MNMPSFCNNKVSNMSDECKVDIEPAEQETSMQSTSNGASNANKWTAATELVIEKFIQIL